VGNDPAACYRAKVHFFQFVVIGFCLRKYTKSTSGCLMLSMRRHFVRGTPRQKIMHSSYVTFITNALRRDYVRPSVRPFVTYYQRLNRLSDSHEFRYRGSWKRTKQAWLRERQNTNSRALLKGVNQFLRPSGLSSVEIATKCCRAILSFVEICAVKAILCIRV
jgi:hypothetical protein